MSEQKHDMTGNAAAALADYDLTPPVHAFVLPDVGINNRIRGVRTGAGAFVWKTYLSNRDPAAILYEHQLLAWLAQQTLSFTTPRLIPTRSGDTLCRAPNGVDWQALFAYLPGQQLDRNDPVLIEAFGAALAELHDVLRGYPMASVPDISAYSALHEIHPAVPDPYALIPADFGLPATAESRGVLARWRALLDTTYAFIAGPYRTLPRQIIHGDFGPSNALAAGGRVSALFDFEFAMPDARAIDVASGFTFVMRLWERDDAAALAMAHHFSRGYARRGGLTAAEIAVVPQLMLLREVVGTIWWAGRKKAATPQRSTERIGDMERLADWLERHEAEFFAALRQA